MDKTTYLIELSGSPRTAFGKTDFLTQQEEQKVFSAIWSLESQVNNGGFKQYFESWDGETANFAPTALRAIGAHACANIVSRALKIASAAPLPHDRDTRLTLIAALDQKTLQALDSLGSEFFAYPDDLAELLFAYVAARPEVFGPVPNE